MNFNPLPTLQLDPGKKLLTLVEKVFKGYFLAARDDKSKSKLKGKNTLMEY